MKYLRILIEPFNIKGSLDDEETLRVDVYEKVQGLLDTESLVFSVEDEEDYENDED